jgi:hypothetical protein
MVGRLRRITGRDDVEIVGEAMEVVVAGVDTRDRLRPRSVVRVGSTYLVEAEPDDWYMGALDAGVIVCWGRYGRLEDALRAL